MSKYQNITGSICQTLANFGNEHRTWFCSNPTEVCQHLTRFGKNWAKFAKVFAKRLSSFLMFLDVFRLKRCRSAQILNILKYSAQLVFTSCACKNRIRYDRERPLQNCIPIFWHLPDCTIELWYVKARSERPGHLFVSSTQPIAH